MQKFQRVREIIHEVTGLPEDIVTPSSTAANLELDSLDITEIILSVEDEFGILVEDDSSIQCVNDLLLRLAETA